MGHLGVVAVMLGFVALALAPLGPVQAEQDTTPHLLTAEELSAPDQPGDAPMILRGSAGDPTQALAAQPGAMRWQIAAGRRLWLIDPVTKDLRTCAVHDTTQVGVNEIRCLSGTAGRFRRTFGPTFAP